MIPEDNNVCLCTRQDFTATQQQKIIELSNSQPVQWDRVYEIAQKHQVSPLVYVNLSKLDQSSLNIPSQVLSRFKKDQIRNVVVKKRTDLILNEILAMFARKDIDVMLVKGAALGRLVYEHPWYIVSFDTDLVIRTRIEDLDLNDYHEIVDCIESFNRDRTEFQEHIEYDFYEHHDVTMNNVLHVDWSRIWAEAIRIPLGDFEVSVMTPEEHYWPRQ